MAEHVLCLHRRSDLQTQESLKSISRIVMAGKVFFEKPWPEKTTLAKWISGVTLWHTVICSGVGKPHALLQGTQHPENYSLLSRSFQSQERHFQTTYPSDFFEPSLTVMVKPIYKSSSHPHLCMAATTQKDY